jgi:hypothetical protein
MISTLETTQVGMVEARMRPLISWGSIFAGWLLGNAIMLLMFNLGSALGLSAVDLSNPEAMGKGLAIGAAAWALFTWATSFFLSGLFAAWLSGHTDKAVGAIHGMTVWALAVVFTVILGISGITGAIKTGTSAAQGAAAVAAQKGQSQQPQQDNNSIIGNIQNQLKDQISQAAAATAGVDRERVQQAVNQLDENTISSISGSLARGNTEEARQALASNTSLSQTDVDRIVSTLSVKTKEAAETTAKVSAGALWLIFLAGLVGLVASMLGGSAGARRLVTSYRRFETIS